MNQSLDEYVDVKNAWRPSGWIVSVLEQRTVYTIDRIEVPECSR